MYSQWSAAMISPADDFAGAPLLRTEFALVPGHGAVLSAELAVSSLGVFEAYLNGRAAGPDVLSPGWSSYEWRLRYRTYDVTGLLRPTTVLGISLGNGWSRGRLGWNGNRALYGDRLGSHRPAGGHLRRWPPAAGEHRRDVAGRAVSDAGERPVRRADHRRPAGRRHVAAPGSSAAGLGQRRNAGVRHQPPHAVRRPARRPPRSPPAGSIWSAPSGRTLVDFGQNLVGWLRFTVTGCGRDRDRRPARRGPRARRARRAAASQRPGHRPVRPVRRRGPLRADQDLPRLPLRRDQRLAGQS